MTATGDGHAEGEGLDAINAAIRAAKGYLLQAFKDEQIDNLGLEEVKHTGGSIWQITLGFSRRWDDPPPRNTFLQMAAIAAAARV